MKYLFFGCFLLSQCLYGQINVTGSIIDDTNIGLPYVNVALYNSADSSLLKVETTDDSGVFNFTILNPGTVDLIASYIGYDDLIKQNISLAENVDLGVLSMSQNSVQLETAVVKAQRALVEVKSDRTVFNVQGTVNSAGNNGLDLLRKAPGVLLDNNNNVTVLGRNGVLMYVDGKRLPITGDDLTNYLRNLTAEQIDRIDIISSPGAKYEAEGNAGIIDIRLKKNENYGTNGSISANLGQGRRMRGGVSATANHRTAAFNLFGMAAYSNGISWNRMAFDGFQNGFNLLESSLITDHSRGFDGRVGMDFFIGKNSTVGFLVSGNKNDSDSEGENFTDILTIGSTVVDSVLDAYNYGIINNTNTTYNLNYVFSKNESSLNFDLDYGSYVKESSFDQPNTYLTANRDSILNRKDQYYETPVDIDIYTAKLDYEKPLFGGKFGIGTKYSKVATDNTFLFFDVEDEVRTQNNQRSNQFNYDEEVLAAYFSFSRKINEKWNFSSGLRVENTDATGNLQAFDPLLEEPPVEFDYTSYFPNFGLTFQASRQNAFRLNYGRRINRPDYNILNPFRSQMSELSFLKGNPFLRPEIVNNIELSLTHAYRFNFTLGYSKTNDQITRLIAPDELNPKAGFLSWDNLATQTIYSFNISAPFQITDKWSSYWNVSFSHKNNQADYGDDVVVDLQAFSYNLYQQQTFDLFSGIKAEISGWFSGPGIWGGVFEYDPSFSLNVGLQKKFLNDKLNVKLSGQDLFFESGWSGASQFSGLISNGMGNWDSQRVDLSLSYNFGNAKVKSRSRKTGLEEEMKRTGGDTNGR